MSSEHSLAKPNAAQLAWHDMEVQMFVHFGPSTWQDREADNQSTPLDRIHPARLDTEQWAEVAKSFGAKQIVFTAKHVGGFAWWQTNTTPYGVRQIPWRNGQGDVLRYLSESCKRHGLKMGVYLSPRDDVFGAKEGGKCATAAEQDRYNAVYRAQLEEVLSRYGRISEVWFDGSTVCDVGDLLRRYAPDTICFQGPHANIRWVGNERGWTPYPAWNAVRAADARSGVSTAAHSNPEGDVWMPIEVDTTLYASGDWFWKSPAAFRRARSVRELMSCYYRSVGHGAVFLLNATPDTSGLIPAEHARRYAEFGAEIERRFARPVAETAGAGAMVELALGRTVSIDHVIVMEDLAEGERVREYVIEGWQESHWNWKRLAVGSAVGHKKIDRFAPALVSRIRFRALRFAASPLIRRLAAFHTGVTDDDDLPVILTNTSRRAGLWSPAELGVSGVVIALRISNAIATAKKGAIRIVGYTNGGAAGTNADDRFPRPVRPSTRLACPAGHWRARS